MFLVITATGLGKQQEMDGILKWLIQGEFSKGITCKMWAKFR